jgi:AraC-like DNA-binding protein
MKPSKAPARRVRRPLPGFVSRQVAVARRYFLDLKPDGREPLAVACGGFERVRPDYRVTREDFPYCCVEFVASGKGRVWLGAARAGEDAGLPLATGTLFAYGPGVPHTIETDTRSPLRKHYIDFVGRQAAARLRAAGLALGQVQRVSHPDEVAEIFDLLLRCGQAQSTYSGPLCGQLLGVLLTKIGERRLPTEKPDPRAAATFTAFRMLLASRPAEWSSIESACRTFGITPAYACRLFARFGESSPYQFLVRRRMSLAAEWLAHDGVRVGDVARRLGFADPCQFSRAFKRVFGLAPAAFRRHHTR